MRLALMGSALAAMVSVASAQTVRIANQGDALSLDPHSLNETLQLSVNANVYESLAGRDKKMNIAPLLATSWKQTSPTVWRFDLRKNVKFHDGTPFTADDVVFSFARAAGEGSDMKAHLAEVKEVRKVDDHTIDIETRAPLPILPAVISSTAIMSKKWCEENQAVRPVDKRKGIENTASFKANGTGPFRVRERQPNVRTTFTRNPQYWGKIDGNVQEVIFTPIASPSTRVAALASGQVDIMEPVPVQDVARLNSGNTRVITGPELRTIFLGMDQKRDELLFSSVKGKNPFKDKRVRQAFYQAIDIDGIRKTIMRDASRPTALMVGPGVNGWNAEQDKRLPYDVEGAKKLMADAGYPSGFEVTMNCPTDRYMNDGQICQAVAANLSKIGVKVNLQAETKGTYFPRVLRRDTSFYMLGWAPTSYDAHNVLSSLTACADDKGNGQFNLGSYCNPKLDEVIKKIQVETDQPKRDALIREAFQIHMDDIGHLPLHQQSLAWGVSRKVDLVQLADNFMFFKWITVKNK
ncbi:ABC transporter substrate-binding protein [Ottowia testudinis]|nr:ABC transporter substrate-binding protein [Ottowia testudinis]